MDHTPYLVAPGQPVDLRAWTTDDDGGLDKRAAKDRTDDLNDRLEALQELLYAEGKHKVLVVIQATDTGGKDGTIRHVFDKVNPQGVKVASFKKPTDEELGHDFLWRVHRQTPKSGEITVFNRSHYEDVLVVRVHDLVPPEQWERRYEHINAFEKLLADEGTTIVKLYLHLSKDEQRQRLQDRLDEADKNWKFDSGDLRERAHWDDYQEAFRVMLERTSTDHAPWHVIPADRKWFRNLLVSEIIVDTLEQLDMAFPPAEEGIRDLVIE
ncbi:MAG: polyphosphate kinase 2 family protein [Acidimicrobiales bacterium]|nr:polyphosphate kinase 2 family protein [Acidimicrobiales bacterium]